MKLRSYFGQQCLYPLFCKGGIFSGSSLTPLWKTLEKRGRGDFWTDRCRNYSTNFIYATLVTARAIACGFLRQIWQKALTRLLLVRLRQIRSNSGALECRLSHLPHRRYHSCRIQPEPWSRLTKRASRSTALQV